MDLSVLVAKIIAVIYITSGAAVLIGTVKISDIVKEYEKSPALIFLSGCMAIIFGMILVNYHNVWVKNWTVLITIISWVILIEGIVVVIMPASLLYMKNFIIESRFWGIFMIVFGSLFGYFGFIA
jgi:hypothetical protein